MFFLIMGGQDQGMYVNMAKSFNNGKYLIHKNLDYKNFYEEEKNTIFLSRQNDGGTYMTVWD